MPKTIQKSTLLFIAALFAVTSGITYAQCPKNAGKDKMPMHGEKTPGHTMIPDLTDSQKDKMKTLHFDHMKALQPLQNEIGEKQARLRTLQTADKVNMSEINVVIEDIGSLRTKIMKMKAAHHQEIRSLLTEEQRVIFDAHQPRHYGPREQNFPLRHDLR
jgi:Spy/CpxP family protein refolding chaperone